jgi:hypothetical protein
VPYSAAGSFLAIFANDKYRRAAMTERNMDHKSTNPEAQAGWLQHAEEWEQIANDAERSSNNEEAEDA